MMPRLQLSLYWVACAAFAAPITATGYDGIDPSSQQVINDVVVYRDATDRSQFYYQPPSLQLATTDAGRPALQLTVTRYVGTRILGDQGEWLTHGRLSLRLHVPNLNPATQQAIKSALGKATPNPKLEPLPLYGIEGVIVYTPINQDVTVLPTEGALGSSPDADNVQQWSDRTYSIRLSEQDAQLLINALETGQTIISYSYAYLTKTSVTDSLTIEYEGNEAIGDALHQHIGDIQTETEFSVAAIHTDAVSLTLSPEVANNHIQRVDINETLIAGYVTIDVYCFDFQQELVAGQYAKRVEIEANGPGGSTVTGALAFTAQTPDIYSQSLRIPRAIDISKPYRYRVVSVSQTGEMAQHADWTERSRWSEILDITYAAESSSE